MGDSYFCKQAQCSRGTSSALCSPSPPRKKKRPHLKERGCTCITVAHAPTKPVWQTLRVRLLSVFPVPNLLYTEFMELEWTNRAPSYTRTAPELMTWHFDRASLPPDLETPGTSHREPASGTSILQFTPASQKHPTWPGAAPCDDPDDLFRFLPAAVHGRNLGRGPSVLSEQVVSCMWRHKFMNSRSVGSQINAASLEKPASICLLWIVIVRSMELWTPGASQLEKVS